MTGPPVIRNTTKTRKPRSALKVHRARQNEERLSIGELWQDQNLVFPDSTGGIVRKENLARRHLKPILEKEGLRKETRVCISATPSGRYGSSGGRTTPHCSASWVTPA